MCKFGTAEILHRHLAILPKKPFVLVTTLKPTVHSSGGVDLCAVMILCCVVVSGGERASAASFVEDVFFPGSPPRGSASQILPRMQLSPFREGRLCSAYQHCCTAVGRKYKEKDCQLNYDLQ
ncbi:Hypothetical predicted protein [Scomber scombrus]|uniref:Uncharacterized protein n=1 Tax=Scomber scombrus TaxID=13677 RepID=A0AAV1PAM3_SCOSC